MNLPISMIAGLALLSQPLSHAQTPCQVKSGPSRAALVELYTSEGCSSCPPADEALRLLHRAAGPGAEVIPLALHVSYWDRIGWKDMYAQKTFDDRQQSLVSAAGGKLVYTPQFFVNGRELRSWNGSMQRTLAEAGTRPPGAHITLTSAQPKPGAISLDAVAMAPPTTGRQALFVALTESALVSHVTRGENSGATLHHDATVRTWIGPVALTAGKASIRQQVPLAPDWNPAHLHAVAFVQDIDDGAILQAVSTARCAMPGRS